MHSLQATVINEIMKIGSRKKAIWFLCLTLVVPVAAAILATNFQSGFGVAAVSAADFPVLVLNVLTTLIIPLLVFMIAADMFAGELGEKTMRIALTRPVARWKVFAAKHIALLFFIGIHLIVALLTSVVASLFLADKGNLMTGWLHAIAAYITAVLPMITLGVLAVFISQWFKNGSGALAVCILLYASAKLIAFVFPQVNLYSPTAYTDWYLLFIGGTVAAGKITSICMFLIACCLIFLTAGFYLFDKKEL